MVASESVLDVLPVMSNPGVAVPLLRGSGNIQQIRRVVWDSEGDGALLGLSSLVDKPVVFDEFAQLVVEMGIYRIPAYRMSQAIRA